MPLVAPGHDTTANALNWTFYLLSKHPSVAERLRGELDQVLAGRAPTLDDLPRLPFAKAVLEESLRLYPTAWIFERQAVVEDEIGGYRVPRKAIVAICPYTLHRHPRYWERPDEFDPDRFYGQPNASRPKYAYLPFGGGPRLCIGNAFAMMEAQIILAMVAQEWSLDLAPGFVVEQEPSVTLRPRHGLMMTRAQR